MQRERHHSFGGEADPQFRRRLIEQSSGVSGAYGMEIQDVGHRLQIADPRGEWPVAVLLRRGDWGGGCWAAYRGGPYGAQRLLRCCGHFDDWAALSLTHSGHSTGATLDRLS